MERGVHSGLTQGSVLELVPINIFINNLGKGVNRFADDTKHKSNHEHIVKNFRQF